ncbi:MAG: hypothetical protein IJZ72_10025 [Oscillospiraceae bacterium]|nr:hypothetical protein [Oscillospiraceae bacterium]
MLVGLVITIIGLMGGILCALTDMLLDLKITFLAMVIILEENGKTRKEAEDTVAAVMYKFIEPQIAVMKKLASSSGFVGLLKISMPIKFRNTPGYGC